MILLSAIKRDWEVFLLLAIMESTIVCGGIVMYYDNLNKTDQETQQCQH